MMTYAGRSGRDAERSDRPQGEVAPRQVRSPAAMKHNTGVSNIEITDQNIRAFSATAKECGFDFAPKKDTGGEIARFLMFF